MDAGLLNLIGWLLRVLSWIIIIDALLTWFPQVNRRNPIVVTLHRITEPIYRPIRKLIPPEKTGYLDLSPLIAVVGIQIIWMILIKLLL